MSESDAMKLQMSERDARKLREDILIVAGRLAEGERITRQILETPLPELVRKIVSDRDLTATQLALIAITLAEWI